MATYAENDTRTTTTPGWPLFAALGAGAALVLTALGTFWDITGNDTAGRDSVGNYLPVVAIVLVATAVVFGLVVRTASASSAGVRALVLAGAGLLSVVVFWTGLPAVLASGAAACALVARDSMKAKAALAIALVTLGLAVYAAIGG